MFISENGLNLIKEFEGCILKSYDDYNNKIIDDGETVKGTLTIGYGHIEGVYKGQVITQEQAHELLRNDMFKYCNMVQALIDNGTILFQLNQNMFDSLTSFCYNLGQGNLTRLCRGRNVVEVSEHFTAYINKGSVWEQGLLRRRKAERDLFLKPYENVSLETIENNNVGGDYMSKVYQNGSTIEVVYSSENMQSKIGMLNPYEKCQAIADVNGKIVVLYDSPSGKKTGFVKYRGGL